MQILLIRHGESEADILNVHEGRADFPLTDIGRKQVRLMAEKVKKEFPPERIWASTLKRASETATVLAEAIGCPIQFEDDLMEYNNGALAGLTYEQAKHIQIPKLLHEPIEKGESAIEFRMRTEAVFSRIIHASTEERIAIVAHGGVMNCLLRSFFRMPVSLDYWFRSGDTAIHFMEIIGAERVVHFLNDTSHLAPLKGEE